MSLLLLLRGEQNVKPARRALRPSLKLHVEVETVDGSIHRWDSDDLTPQNRPLSVSWRTQRGDGFADGSLTLNRDILRDWPDLGLVDTVRIIGADGQVRYEGRNVNVGRESGDSGSQFKIQLAGWMSHAKDRRMKEVYIDRDRGRWTNDPSLTRQLQLIAAATPKNYLTGSSEEQIDPGSSQPSIRQQHTRLADTTSTRRSTAETWYSAGGIPIGVIGGEYADKDAVTNAALSASEFFSSAYVTTGDSYNGSDGDGGANLAGTSGSWSVSATAVRRFAFLQFLYYSNYTGDGDWNAWWKNLYVLGTHGLTLAGGGLPASQMIRDSAQRFCPRLDPSGIDTTTYPIRHAETVDPAYPYDFWLRLNAAHQWDLSVWEEKILYFRSLPSLDDYDWQVRTDDPGVRISYGGTALADLGNGVEVAFDDLDSGTRKVITPFDYSDLSDPDPNNPITRAGLQKWITYDVPFPTLEADAVQYGRAYLQEAIRAKAPATITVGHYIRDRAGNWQPASKVRSEERIALVDHPNDAPRRIIDSNYTHDGRGLVMSADRASTRLSAITDRISLGRTIAGLS